jgi:LPXTG-motif cell wall-anchored protein
MKTIVRIVALFALTFGLLFSAGSAAFAQSTGDDAVVTSDEATTDDAANAEASPVVPIETPAVDEGTSTPDDGEFDPATIGEVPGGDFHEEIDGTIRLTSDLNSGDGYASLDLPVPAGATIAGLTDLGVDFILEADDDCGGGSPRFSIGVDMDNDGNADFYLYVTFDPCVAGGANSTGNLVVSDAPHTFGPAGGPLTWAEVVANYGTGKITYLGLVVDGGGGQPDGEQTIFVQSVTGVASAFEGVSNLRVIKTQDTTEGPVVPGACFTIFALGEGGTRGDIVADQQCDDDLDGNVDFLGLPALTGLIVAETVAPEGYAPGADFPITLAEGDNFLGFPNSLLPDSTATPTATATTPVEASPTATSPGPAEPTSTTSTNPPSTGSTTDTTSSSSTGSTSVTTLPSTGTGTNSSSSLSLGLIAALLTLVVISGGYLITKRRNA